MYAKVIIDTKSRFLNRAFTYHIPEKFNNKISKGMRVIVPFGRTNKSTIAFIYDLINDYEGDFETKDIIEIYDSNKIVSDELIELSFYMSSKYISPIQASIKQVLPPGNITEIKKYYYSKVKNDDLLIKFLNTKKTYEDIKNEFGDVNDILEKYIDKDYIGIDYHIKTQESIKYKEIVSIYSGKKIELNKNAIKQIEIINFLKKNNNVDLKTLLAETSSSRTSLNSLVKKGYLKIEKVEIKRNILKENIKYKKLKLNDEQEKAYNTILDKPSESYVLKGVTGSGKTEIFLQLVEENLKKGKEAIILVPEISLTPQTIERFTGRFGNKIAIIHSGLNISERFDQWRAINNGEVKIVIGARSAIFAPFKNIGIIIIDEEHDQSYISSKDPKYHTSDIAKFRRKYHQASLIMASATPSINTMVECEKGNYKLLELKKRINNSLPKIEIVDMREELKNSNYSMISRRLYEQINDKLSKNEQIILFLNKIGHNSYTFCRQCGYVIKCDACDVSMTYHKKINKLVCHYCGRTKNQPNICPNCGSKKIKEFGAGTEKLEEEVKTIFKKARVLRMDSETTLHKESYSNMYKIMKNNQADILIGTQMIAKGLDFKNVTLVGIISADLSLNIDDYTAEEKTFQLLTQVSGRAGRDIKNGNVIIQTYRPDNFVIKATQDSNYEYFYKKELAIRKAFEYPPYTNLITIKIVDKTRNQVLDISKELKNELDNRLNIFESIKIIGPNPCKIERINNKHRFNILLKVADNYLNEIIEIISQVRNEFLHKYKNTSFIVAINPSSIN